MPFIAFSLLALTAVLGALHSCKGTEDTSKSELEETVPGNQDREVTCNLAPLSANAKQDTFRNRNIRYYSADEIDYASETWWKKGSPWMSFDGLDSSVLGYPGYAGNDPSFAPDAPVNMRVVAIDMRNIQGKMHYHYFSNETANSPLENWSSTKSFVMLQAIHSIRQQTGAGALATVYPSSGGGSASGWVGDHVNEVARTSNNGYAAWFKSITGSQGSQNFVRNWIGTPATFGGLHGENPASLGRYASYQDTAPRKLLPNAQNWQSNGTSNTLMPIVMAESWKRLAVNAADKVTWLKNADYTSSTVDANQKRSRFFNANAEIGVTPEDLKVLLYGFVNSKSNGGLQLGATQHDEFVQAFGGKTRLDRLTGGKWRLFGKTGSGFSNQRNRNEAAFGGFLCIPADPNRANLKEGRLLAFFINSQTTGSAGGPRLTTLNNLAQVMIPELNGARSVWGPAPQINDPDSPLPSGGVAVATAATVMKLRPDDAASLSTGEKCSVAAGVELPFVAREPAAKGHTRLERKEGASTCPGLGKTVFIFTPHFNFSDN